MAKKNKSLDYVVEESFELILDIDKSAISTVDLIKYLSNTDALVKSINHTLNYKYSIGYDQITIDVLALEKGSFKIPVIIKKLSENPTLSIVIGGIALKLLMNDPAPTVYNFNHCDVTINQTELIENKETVKAVSNIAKTVIESDDVKAISVNYEKSDGSTENIRIEKNTLRGVVADEVLENDKDSHLLPNAHLVIVGPVLESEPANWTVRINGRKLSAKMMDDSFLRLMDEQKIAFGKGDVIIADLETVVTKKSDNTPFVKHYIKKVYDYPKYTSRQNPEQKLDFK